MPKMAKIEHPKQPNEKAQDGEQFNKLTGREAVAYTGGAPCGCHFYIKDMVT